MRPFPASRLTSSFPSTNSVLPSSRKTVNLTVDSTEGGRWIYPFIIHSTPAEPDDNIVIRASGLHKESVVGIRLNSLDRLVASSSSIWTADVLFFSHDATLRLLTETFQMSHNAMQMITTRLRPIHKGMHTKKYQTRKVRNLVSLIRKFFASEVKVLDQFIAGILRIFRYSVGPAIVVSL